MKQVSLTVGDAAQLARLHQAGFPPEQAWTLASLKDLLQLPTTAAIGLEQDKTLLAFILVQIVAGEAEILTLVTSPDHQRKGLARHLLGLVEQDLNAAGVEKWLLDVAEDNLPAIRFYKSCGFEIDGRRADYYARLEGSRIDAILMSKRVARQAAP